MLQWTVAKKSAKTINLPHIQKTPCPLISQALKHHMEHHACQLVVSEHQRSMTQNVTSSDYHSILEHVHPYTSDGARLSEGHHCSVFPAQQ